jgi:hypothetical protein
VRLDHLLSKEQIPEFSDSRSSELEFCLKRLRQGQAPETAHIRVTIFQTLFNFEGPARKGRNLHKRRQRSEKKTPRAVWGCSSAGRAPALHAGGQEFEPPHLHQTARAVERWGHGEKKPTEAKSTWAHSSGG